MPPAHMFRVIADNLRYSQTLRRLNARILVLKASRQSAASSRLALLSRAYGHAEEPVLESATAARIASESARVPSLPETLSTLSGQNPRYRKALTKSTRVNRGVLLKAPGPDGEKGVMLVTFEYNWVRMLRGIPDWTALEAQYDIIFSNSWSPTDYALVLEVLSRLQGDMFAQTNNRGDIPRLSRLNSRIHGVPTMPSDWIHPAYYQPKPMADRAYDIVMVANWAPFKRHWEFFSALHQLPASWRILLLGQPEAGRTMSDVQALASEYGIKQDITWKERLPIHEVAKLQAEGRISVVLSRREGACVAAAEALLADSPIALRENAHIGARAYINDSTGLLLRPGHLAADLQTLWTRAPNLSARQWAVDHASSPAAHESLNTFMRAASARRGLPWTRDLAPHCWRPYPSLLQSETTGHLNDSAASLATLFPEAFDQSLVTTVSPAQDSH